MPDEFTGKAVVITGAAGIYGAQLAENFAAAGAGKAGDRAEQCGFARAIASDQGQARSRRRGQLDVAQGCEVAIELPDTFNGDRVHRSPSPPRLPGCFVMAVRGRATRSPAPGFPARWQ